MRYIEQRSRPWPVASRLPSYIPLAEDSRIEVQRSNSHTLTTVYRLPFERRNIATPSNLVFNRLYWNEGIRTPDLCSPMGLYTRNV